MVMGKKNLSFKSREKSPHGTPIWRSAGTSDTQEHVKWSLVSCSCRASYKNRSSSLVFSSGDPLGWLLAHWVTPDLWRKSEVCILLPKSHACILWKPQQLPSRGSGLFWTSPRGRYISHMSSSVSHSYGVICGPFPFSPWPGQKTHPPPSVKSLKLLWSIWTRTGFIGKALPRRGSPESFPFPQNVGVGEHLPGQERQKVAVKSGVLLSVQSMLMGVAFSCQERWILGEWPGGQVRCSMALLAPPTFSPGQISSSLQALCRDYLSVTMTTFSETKTWGYEFAYGILWVVRVQCCQPDQRN